MKMLGKAMPSLAEKYLHLGGCGRICACGDASRTIRGIRREEGYWAWFLNTLSIHILCALGRGDQEVM